MAPQGRTAAGEFPGRYWRVWNARAASKALLALAAVLGLGWDSGVDAGRARCTRGDPKCPQVSSCERGW